MTLDLEVQRACSAPAPDDDALAAAVRAALAGRVETAALCIRIVDNAESAALNLRYRQRQGPTNVLSFGCDAALLGVAAPLGDLVLCAPIVTREAMAQGKCLHAHWQHLVVHGVLHLLGYDHIGDDDAITMENQERAILAQLDIADPYAARPVSAPSP